MKKSGNYASERILKDSHPSKNNSKNKWTGDFTDKIFRKKSQSNTAKIQGTVLFHSGVDLNPEKQSSLQLRMEMLSKRLKANQQLVFQTRQQYRGAFRSLLDQINPKLCLIQDNIQKINQQCQINELDISRTVQAMALQFKRVSRQLQSNKFSRLELKQNQNLQFERFKGKLQQQNYQLSQKMYQIQQTIQQIPNAFKRSSEKLQDLIELEWNRLNLQQRFSSLFASLEQAKVSIIKMSQKIIQSNLQIKHLRTESSVNTDSLSHKLITLEQQINGCNKQINKLSELVKQLQKDSGLEEVVFQVDEEGWLMDLEGMRLQDQTGSCVRMKNVIPF